METINVNKNYKLRYAYDCDTDRAFYDVYELNGRKKTYIGTLDDYEVEDCLLDDDTYDMDALEELCENL